MCHQLQVLHECTRRKKPSRVDETKLKRCKRSKCTTLRVQVKTRVTTGWCDTCGPRPGYEGYIPPHAYGGRGLLTNHGHRGHTKLGPRRGCGRKIPSGASVGRKARWEAVATDSDATGGYSSRRDFLQSAAKVDGRSFHQGDHVQQFEPDERPRYEMLHELADSDLSARHAARGAALRQTEDDMQRQMENQRTEMDNQFHHALVVNHAILEHVAREIQELTAERDILLSDNKEKRMINEALTEEIDRLFNDIKAKRMNDETLIAEIDRLLNDIKEKRMIDETLTAVINVEGQKLADLEKTRRQREIDERRYNLGTESRRGRGQERGPRTATGEGNRRAQLSEGDRVPVGDGRQRVSHRYERHRPTERRQQRSPVHGGGVGGPLSARRSEGVYAGRYPETSRRRRRDHSEEHVAIEGIRYWRS